MTGGEAFFGEDKPYENDKKSPTESLQELIMSSPVAEKAYRDFMWMHVGHPDPQQRQAEGLPTVLRVWRDELYSYSEQLLAGYTDRGDLIEVRSVEPIDGLSAKEYFMVISHLKIGELEEPIVHQIRNENDGVTLQLLDRKICDNWPPMSRPGTRAPIPDQWRITLRRQQTPRIINGRYSSDEIYPIENLAATVNEALIERDGQLEVRRKLGGRAIDGFLGPNLQPQS